jgi:hypothetical protein
VVTVVVAYQVLAVGLQLVQVQEPIQVETVAQGSSAGAEEALSIQQALASVAMAVTD